ncbi:MAG: hypothetical protein EA424_17620 [Planctomycetaceae bacterium]|nr:MAG: hypothetical protein EA424_17620 [Planctomycetaceae bacterium]
MHLPILSGLTLVGPWQTRAEYPPLPETVTSFGAALIEDALYIYGGHTGRAHQYYHEGQAKTLWRLNLAEPDAWEALGEGSGLQGLALVADGGKIYAIGGMQAEGGPTTRVDIYDPDERQWQQGPSLQGQGMDGFGSAAFASGDRLYVSTMHGTLQRLAQDGSAWEIVQELEHARFFHRMLPLSDHRLLMIGGANMAEGKFEQLEVLVP